jgi:5-methyltetrahydrofolate--homocysteine methyltransferase
MQSRPDIASVAQDWDRFWANALPGPLVAAVVPRRGVAPAPKPSSYAAGPEMDVEAFADQALRWFETHEFVGGAIPFAYLEFAADQFATFLGADLVFTAPGEGGWPTHPLADVPLESVEIRFERQGLWWQRLSAMAARLMERWQGAILVAAPTFVANLDALVALRGANQVLLDLVDRPEAVHRALDQIDRACAEVMDAFAALLEFGRLGSINRHGMYSTGRTNLPQCDFSCLIGPAMFAEFARPYLQREMARQDGSEYHLDGPGALHHLETLCAMAELDVVQWVAGAARQGEDWSDLYRRIDRLGKGQILGGKAAGLERWRRELTAGRLFWNLAAGSRAEAEDAIARSGSE